jgi:hypothetical protein
VKPSGPVILYNNSGGVLLNSFDTQQLMPSVYSQMYLSLTGCLRSILYTFSIEPLLIIMSQIAPSCTMTLSVPAMLSLIVGVMRTSLNKHMFMNWLNQSTSSLPSISRPKSLLFFSTTAMPHRELQQYSSIAVTTSWDELEWWCWWGLVMPSMTLLVESISDLHHMTILYS